MECQYYLLTLCPLVAIIKQQNSKIQMTDSVGVLFPALAQQLLSTLLLEEVYKKSTATEERSDQTLTSKPLTYQVQRETPEVLSLWYRQ